LRSVQEAKHLIALRWRYAPQLRPDCLRQLRPDAFELFKPTSNRAELAHPSDVFPPQHVLGFPRQKEPRWVPGGFHVHQHEASLNS
jgi:hypothetical protein